MRNEVHDMDDRTAFTNRLFAPITPEELAAIPQRGSVGRYKASLGWAGWCPTCGRYDGVFNIEANQYGACHAHKKAWWLGTNVLSVWKEEDASIWRQNYVQMHDYERCDHASMDWRLVDDAVRRAGVEEVQRSFEADHPMECQWLVAQSGFCDAPWTFRKADGSAFDESEAFQAMEKEGIQVPLTRDACRAWDGRIKSHRDESERQAVRDK